MFEWYSLGVGVGVLRWGGCVLGGVGGWVSECVLDKWQSYVITHYNNE